jgi:helicase
MQTKVVDEGRLLDEPRVVVCAPTASGKTLLALLKIADHWRQTKQKAVYVVPLRALATEKYREFKDKFEPLGMNVSVATGDLDSDSVELHVADVIVVTSEKMDSLLRHRTEWVKEIGLAVVDEVHLLGDESRGATLEVVMTKLRTMETQMLLLSATVPNAKEMADWIGGNLVKSDYRPTRLIVGMATDKDLQFAESPGNDAPAHVKFTTKYPVGEIISKALAANANTGQVLVFVSSRRNAESLAEDLAALVGPKLSESDRRNAEDLARKALGALEPPTAQCKALALCLRNGVSFHHAGLVAKDREIIETGFKQKRCTKVIVATTTLAMGIDFPASWVLVKDIWRFNGRGMDLLPNLEVQQMLGRAGRPRYDKQGVGVLWTTQKSKQEAMEKYVLGPLETIYSQLSSEPSLRMHALGLISAGQANDHKELFSFFEQTFFAHQYGKSEAFLAKVETVLQDLKDMDFVREKNQSLHATPVGKRVSDLYIDPLTGYSFVQFAKKEGAKVPFSYLLALTKATEMRPLVAVTRDEEAKLWDEMYETLEDEDADRLARETNGLDQYKTAKLLNAWIHEATEDEIFTAFKLPPGVLHNVARNSEWLAYAMEELAFLLNSTPVYKAAKNLTRRLRHGIKEELLPLVAIPRIGRVRARRLFDAGIRSAEDYRASPKDRVRAIIHAPKKIHKLADGIGMEAAEQDETELDDAKAEPAGDEKPKQPLR